MIDKLIKKLAFRSLKSFTMIELLVVIFVLVILTSLTVTFSQRGKTIIVLNAEKLKMLKTFYYAKNMAQGAFSNKKNEFPCGYGIKFYPSKNEYILFKDIAKDCSNSDFQYSGPDELIKKFKIDKRVLIKSISFDSFIFIPPQIKVKIFPDQEKGKITLETIDKKTETSIEINKGGQITL